MIERGPLTQLSPNVVVKWQAYNEWTDEKTGKRWYRWEMRFCVLPKKMAEDLRARGNGEIIVSHPDRSFQVVDLPDGVQMFPFQTVRYEDEIL